MRQFAFLRAVNVGGRKAPSAVLARAFEAAGCTEVSPFLASGNVSFLPPKGRPAGLVSKLEAALDEALGFENAVFLRNEEELHGILDRHRALSKKVKALAENVLLLSEEPDATVKAFLKTLETGKDRFFLSGREIHWFCVARQSDSEFSNAVFEKKTRLRTTIRQASTLEKWIAKLEGAPK